MPKRPPPRRLTPPRSPRDRGRPPRRSPRLRRPAPASPTAGAIARSLLRWGQTQLGNVVATPDRRRLLVVWGVLVAAGAFVLANLFYLQVIQARSLRQFASHQQQPPPTSFVPRRSITDRRGTLLAVDRPAFSLYVHPQLFRRPAAEIAEAIAPLLDRPAAEVERRFRESQTGIRLADAISEDDAERLRSLGFDGLELVRYPARLYPQNELAAAVVGYVNFDGQGQAGLEYAQQPQLRRPVEAVGERPGEAGILDRAAPAFVRFDDLQLQLTLDMRLQRSVREALRQQMDRFSARQGTVVVMDGRDGSLLSLVSEPSYDPNRYYETPVERFKNWALSDIYEPGSTFKPINVAIALESGQVRPNDSFYDPGQIFVDGWEIANYNYEATQSGWGQLSVTEILRDSSNVGMVRMMQQLEPAAYYDWLERLQLGEPTEIELPFEAAGQIKTRSQFLGSPVEAATTSFGQGFAITPIQLVQLYGSLANGGYLVSPRVVRGLADATGRLQRELSRPSPQRVFSSETVTSVLAMMEEVVTSGTGRSAQVPGYRIAGKTGTAQKSLGDGGGYSESAVVTSFVAVFPVESPRYVVLVAIDEPDSGTGGEVAAPVAKSAIEQLVMLEGIPPSSARALD